MYYMIRIMKVRNVLIEFVITVCITSCQLSTADVAHVKGNLPDAAGIKLILQEMDTKEIHSIDSVVPDQSGKFSFTPVIMEPGFWLIKDPTGKIIVLLVQPGDHVELSGSVRDFPDQIVMKGPEETMLLNDFFRHTRVNERRVDSLEMLLVERQDSSDYYQLTQKLDTSFRQIWESQRKYEMSYIDTHSGSLASLVVLNYAFGMSPVLGEEEDFGYYQKLDSALYKKFPKNKHVKFHHQRVTTHLRKVPGKL